MRVKLVPVMLAALVAGGCDRQSTSAPQGEAAANVATRPDEATGASPDEATGAAPAVEAGAFDRSRKGEAAPALEFTDPDGKTVTLAAFKGKPVLVNLWATWCAPCIKEMPTLDALAAREAGKIAVVAIAQDMEPAKVTEFWTKGGYKALRPSLDPKLGFSTTLGANLPMTILYDAGGKEVWRVAGVREWADAETAKALAEAS